MNIHVALALIEAVLGGVEIGFGIINASQHYKSAYNFVSGGMFILLSVLFMLGALKGENAI